MVRAVVDVGSNSVLLTVARKDGDKWSPVLERTWVTALGAGTKQTGVLGELGMSATLDALAEAFGLARDLDAVRILAGATMAARIARNTDEFLNRASSQGTPVFVLSGEDEARLGFLSVANDPIFASYPTIAIIDVGGHSTEIAVAERTEGGWKDRFRKSFSIGSLALLSGPLSAECPDGPALLRASHMVDEAFSDAEFPAVTVLPAALGATGTNLVSIREGFAHWTPEKVHGALLDYEEISHAAAWLNRLTLAERSQLVGLETGREATLPGGALILERSLFALRAEQCRVSVHGWRHALLEEMDDPAYSSTREK